MILSRTASFCKDSLSGAWGKRRYYVPGMALFVLLFLVGNAMNFSLSYMGNTNEEVAAQIIKTFWWKILYQLIKIFLAYLFIGGALGALYYAALEKTVGGMKAPWRRGAISIASVALLMVHVFLLITNKLIVQPQLYIDSFAVHFKAFACYQDFLTGHVHPLAPTIPLVIMTAAALGIVLLAPPTPRKYFEALQTLVKSRYRVLAALVAAVLLLALFLYRLKDSFSAAGTVFPNILVLSSDAVRPDHLGGNGYGRDTTPNIDLLMEKSIQFRGVITALPRTFPAWVSLLTSRYPLTHDIRHMFPRSRERNVPLESAGAVLKTLGYRTAVISDYAGDIFPRIDLGFDRVRALTFSFDTLLVQMLLEKQTFLMPFISNRIGDMYFPELRGIAKYSHHETVTRETINEINASRGAPFFITVFYSATHFPYSVPFPYYKKFADPKYRGPYRYYKQVVISMDGAGGAVQEDSDADRRQVIALYDGSLNLLDREIGKVLEHLRENGLLDNTIIVFTSDHGENLYDRDLGMGHGEHLRGLPALEVPFVLYYPGIGDRAGSTVYRFSSQIDIMPTVFDAAGIPRPGFFEGVSLLRKKEWRDGERVDAYCETGLWFDYNRLSPLFFHHNRISYPDVTGLMELDTSYHNELVILQKYQNITNAAKYRSIISGRYKLIYLPLPGGARYELYDQAADPYNEKDIAKANPFVLKRMKKLFFDFIDEKSSGNFIRVGDFLYPVFSDPIM